MPELRTKKVEFPDRDNKSFWRYASSTATSPWVAWPVLALLSFNSIPSGLLRETSNPVAAIANVAFAFVIAGVFFTVFGWVVNRFFPRLTRARILSISLLFGLTETVRIQSVYLLSVNLNISDEYGLAFQLVASFTTGLLLLALVSTARGDYLSYRRSYGALAQRLRERELSLSTTLANAEQTRAQFILLIREQLRDALKSSLESTTRTLNSYSELVDSLFRVSDEVVRPLSHELSLPRVSTEVVNLPGKPPRPALRELISDSSTFAPFKPVEMTVIFTLLTAPTLLLFPGLGYALPWVLSVALLWLLTWACARVITRGIPRWPLAIRSIFMSVIFALPMVFYTVVGLSPVLLGLEINLTTMIFVSLLGAALGWLIAISEGLWVSRGRIIARLESIEAELRWSRVRAQTQLWLQHKRLSLALHNTVQGTLIAAAMKLRNAIDAGEDQVEKTLPLVREMIEQCIEFSPTGAATHSLSDRVRMLNENWDTLISLELQADHHVIELLESDPVALEALAEILSEFQTNSLKHGHATKTTAAVAISSLNAVTVTLRNNGESAVHESMVRGLGNDFLESVSLRYEITAQPEGVQVLLDLPIDVRATQPSR